MSLQDRLDAFKASFESGAPPYSVPKEAVATMHRATAELIASGQAARAKRVGDRAPEFSLPDPDGRVVQSRDLLARGPLVLSFYRGVWCPYCNLEMQALQEALAEIVERGAGLVVVSPQTQANSRRLTRDHALQFPVLTDAGGAVADAYGLRFTLPDYLVELYKGFKVDLVGYNADPAWTLPMPARYVIGTDGIIVYAEVSPDYSSRPDPSELLPVLDWLRGSAAA
jgi:peroxiredoxin